mmetsp:Transcript_12824/g.28953  ORF Transcript_12824/g.28953 Transcript_12824/m.28953 type:complete len:201 (-) Transcript_12824:569-1171(-)
MVYRVQLLVEPHVKVDDRNSLQLVELTKEGHLRPSLGSHALHDVNRHGGDVHIRLNDSSIAHQQAADRTVFVRHDLLDRSLEPHLSTTRLYVRLHGRAQSVGLVAVKKSHLQSVVLVKETVHRSEHDRHGELIGIDEVESLCHRNKDFLVDPVGHAVLSHEIKNRKLVLSVDEVLALNQHWEQRRCGLELLLQREHLLVE